MAELWAFRIHAGWSTIDDVPKEWREKVLDILSKKYV